MNESNGIASQTQIEFPLLYDALGKSMSRTMSKFNLCLRSNSI